MSTVRCAALSTLLLLGCPMSAIAEDTLWAQLLSADLKPTRAWVAPAGGEVVSLVTLPVGGLTALVQPASGPPVLGRWSAEGKPLSRQPLPLKGPAREAERLRDGGWLVVAGSELVRLGDDGQIVGRRDLPGEQPAPEAMALGLAGVWLAWPDRLLYRPLEGEERSWKRPFQEPPLETCRKEFKHPEECRYEIRLESLAPIGEDRCLVIESLTIYHNASGPNTTRQAALTLVEDSGETVSRRLVGKVTSSLQWFNFDHLSGNSSGLPGPFTLVRRSYQGSTVVRFMAVRGGDLLLAVWSDGVRTIERVNAALGTRWARPTECDAAAPPWTNGILLFADSTLLRSFDEDGKPLASGSLFVDRYATTSPPPTVQLRDVPDRSKLRNVIGQTPAGEWLLVSY